VPWAGFGAEKNDLGDRRIGDGSKKTWEITRYMSSFLNPSGEHRPCNSQR
jgi:hypothetical protein